MDSLNLWPIQESTKAWLWWPQWGQISTAGLAPELTRESPRLLCDPHGSSTSSSVQLCLLTPFHRHRSPVCFLVPNLRCTCLSVISYGCIGSPSTLHQKGVDTPALPSRMTANCHCPPLLAFLCLQCLDPQSATHMPCPAPPSPGVSID